MKIPKRRKILVRARSLKHKLVLFVQRLQKKPRLFWYKTGAVALAGVLLIAVLIILSNRIDDYNYSRGVLSLNTDKSSYRSGETVLFQMSALARDGKTLCTSSLRLEIAVPEQRKKTVLKYKDSQIVPTATCDPENTITNEPDYISRFVVNNPGTYKVRLVNEDTGKKVESAFTVEQDHPDFQIQRASASRINPFISDRYPMVISVTAKEDFKGSLVETVPSDFTFAWIGQAKVTESGQNKILTWDVELKAGETKEFAYEYDAPNVSPGFIRLGQAQLLSANNSKVYEESRAWQIAQAGQ